MRRSLASEQSPEFVNAAFRVFTQRKIGFAIDFAFENGRRRAFSYSELLDAEYNPELGGIIIEGVGKRVTILGINLEGLYELLIDHEVGQITERHEPEHMQEAVVNRGEAYIKQVMWERV
ncbi:MAG: hypothetical protein C0519_09640 [Hyphomicrobium sp.]|nr:hypothetical protein [Hyphomicrobium sp.]